MARRRRHAKSAKPAVAKSDVAKSDAVMSDAVKNDAVKNDAVKGEGFEDGAVKADAAKDEAVENTAAPADTKKAEKVDLPVRPAKKPRRAAKGARNAFDILTQYEASSLAHVAGLPEQLDAPGLWRGVGYRVGHKRLASGFDEVGEILPMPPVTPVPGAQPWMLGVANIRGNLLPIVDLKQFLEGERTVLTESQRVLIVRQPGGDVAVTIDELFGQRSFQDEQQQPKDDSPQFEGRYSHFIDRVYRLADDSWGVFSLERLARTPEFRQAAA